ncbi:adhesion G-protein coupled receptor G5-like [Sardina pilchardus]|uniref:adhesion G-protein coupled receptor G5-like n=1 Tax=Sardina pilchardus TaxID=27697 RepID=UPI002E0ECDE1
MALQSSGSFESCETVNISYYNESGFSVSIPRCHLNINDSVGNFSCQWSGSECYSQCSSGNSSLVNLTDSVRVCFLDRCKSFYLPESNMSCITIVCTQSDIIELLQKYDNQNATIEDLKRILDVKRICQNVFDDPELVQTYIDVEYKIIHNVIRSTSINTSAVEHDLGDMLMTITGANCSTHHNLINATSHMVVPGYVPVEIQIPLEAFHNIPEDQQKAAVIHYSSPQQFTVSQEVDLVSSVVRVELAEKPNTPLNTPLSTPLNTPLSTPLSMTFTVDRREWEVNSTDNFSCQYYDEFTASELRWSSRGCELALLDSEDSSRVLVQCRCDHMTPFAVLLIPGLEGQLGHHWTILSYLSYIGCGLSALFCGIAIFTYVILRKVWTDTSAEIHISLSGALLLLNGTFLMNEWAAGQEPAGVCVCVAVAIEYALLSSFTWMAIEALHLYLMLIRVFNVYYARYMLKLSLIGWGVPAVVVALSMVVRLDDGHIAYGLVENQDSGYCWIRDQVFAYGLNVTFFSLVFLLNSGVLITVSWRILRTRHSAKGAGPGQAAGQSCGSVLTVLGLTCLLGSCWGLAFLSYGHTHTAVLYLFCILNSLQGFFLFLWVYGTGRKRRREQQEATSTSSSMDGWGLDLGRFSGNWVHL